eukprot:TRINITY_DN1321_c0_g4_i1.p1 TRINITY_DN1321_c0_g4~~TRINITY_DN1321_c0_g4_i1.p1  ORF type:complete len:510 (+),score=51.77 TRINITY_DN1321_c0_g4_i1:269-1798(+)
MQQIVLNISSSAFNVIKYVAFTLIITPVYEFLLNSIIERQATLHVLLGQRVAFSDTNFGIFSLHSTFWGRSRNRFVLLLIGILIIAIELLMEFSFSSVQIPLSGRKQVWTQPSHQQRYQLSKTRGIQHLEHEPLRFPMEAALAKCPLGGKIHFLRRNISQGEHELKFQYYLNRTYTIRAPYLDATDNLTMHCNLQVAEKAGEVWVPFVSAVFTLGEGFDSSKQNYNFFAENHDYEEVDLELQPLSPFMVADVLTFPYSANNSLCIGLQPASCPVGEGAHCISSLRTPLPAKGAISVFFCTLRTRSGISVALAHGSGTESIRIHTIVMHVSGDVYKSLYEQDERQLRLLLVFLFLNRDWRLGNPVHTPIISKTQLEKMHELILLVSTEDGVSGLRQKKEFRDFHVGETEVVTVKQLAFIPGALVLLFLVLLVLYQVLLSKKLSRSQSKRGKHSVGVSLQWLRRQIVQDISRITKWEFGEESVAYRLVVQHGSDHRRLQLLPCGSTIRGNK